MTKAELRKMAKLEHMVGNGKADEHKRNLMRKKIELQKAKIKTLETKLAEMQAKISSEKAKGMTMVDEYNYFIGVTMQEHKEDLEELRGKQAAENAKTDILAAANENSDLIAQEPAENAPKNDDKAERDTKPVTDAKTHHTAKKTTNTSVPAKNGQKDDVSGRRDTQSNIDAKTQKTVQKTAKTDDTDTETVSAQDWAWMAKQFGITPVEESSKEEKEETVNNPFFGNYA